MKITDEMRQAVKTVYFLGHHASLEIDAVITVLAPLILEEAAKEAMRLAADEYRYIPDGRGALGEAAIAIRALSPTSHTSPEE